MSIFSSTGQFSADGNETRGLLQFVPAAEDGGQLLTCLARRFNGTTDAIDRSAGRHEASRRLVVHCKRRSVFLTNGMQCATRVAVLPFHIGITSSYCEITLVLRAK